MASFFFFSMGANTKKEKKMLFHFGVVMHSFLYLNIKPFKKPRMKEKH
jgi:hypothetical protein